jgi:hypothetical protein
MKTRVLLLTLLSAVSLALATPDFVHPGVLLGAQQLAFVKQQIGLGVAPFNATLQKALAYTFVNKRNQSSMSPDWNGTISCGFFGTHDYGCGNLSSDAESALMQSYLWAATSDAKWAERATSILNFYGQNLLTYDTSWGNGLVVSGWTTTMLARAAEILSSTGAPWLPADVTDFRTMFNRAAVAKMWDGACENGNWELTMIEGLASIAVFTENRTIWDHAIEMWNIRVPAYIYISDDGPTHKPGPARCGKYSPYWYNQLVFNSSVDGVSQETCRDFGHTAYGLAATFNVAETALIQGLDLYTPNLKRLHATVDFHTAFLNAGAAAGWPRDPYHKPALNVSSRFVCNGTNLSLAYGPTYQVALTGLERAGVTSPEATNYTQSWVWKLTGGDILGQFMVMYEPLTHGAPAPSTK